MAFTQSTRLLACSSLPLAPPPVGTQERKDHGHTWSRCRDTVTVCEALWPGHTLPQYWHIENIGLCVVSKYLALPSCRLYTWQSGALGCIGSVVDQTSNWTRLATRSELLQAERTGWRCRIQIMSLCQEYLYKCPSFHISECNLHRRYSLLFIPHSFGVKTGCTRHDTWPSRPGIWNPRWNLSVRVTRQVPELVLLSGSESVHELKEPKTQSVAHAALHRWSTASHVFIRQQDI